MILRKNVLSFQLPRYFSKKNTQKNVSHLRPRIKLKIPTLQFMASTKPNDRRCWKILRFVCEENFNGKLWYLDCGWNIPSTCKFWILTLLFHVSKRAGTAAGTRTSSRQSWLSIASCQCAILYPESLRVSAYAVPKNMRHTVLAHAWGWVLLVCLFGVETSRFTQLKFVLYVLCSMFCARIYGILCVCVCSAFSLVQSPLHVLSVLSAISCVCVVHGVLSVTCAMFFVCFALSACICTCI